VPVLTVIAGPNGSGKSTLTASLRLERQSNLIDPDQIARRMNPAGPASAAVAAGREAISRCRAYLVNQSSFAVETTLAGKGPIAMIREAKARGYGILVFFIALSNPELNIHRVSMRVQQGGHDVPDADIRRRYERSLANAAEALLLAHEAVVFDNSGLRRQRMLEIRNGQIIWRAKQVPEWVAGLERQISRAVDLDR
jgi:predicted ABC-type ATPase